MKTIATKMILTPTPIVATLLSNVTDFHHFLALQGESEWKTMTLQTYRLI